MTTSPAKAVAGKHDTNDHLPIRDRIVGAWQLLEYSLTSDEGDVHYPLGPNAQGLIIYTLDGFMSAQLMQPDRPRYQSDFVHAGRATEFGAAAAGYLAYSGWYRVDEEHSIVYHSASLSLYPNWIGRDLTRPVRFDDDLMTLSTKPIALDNVVRRPAIIWRRLVPLVAPAHFRGAFTN